jgi:hypothetical protein
MLKLNVTQEKQLTFEVQIEGVQHDQVSSQFKIIINEIEYGFPAKVGRETITVNLPPLNKVVAGKIVEGDEVDVKLEIIADGHYLTPWQDRASLSNPLIIEAKIQDTSFVPNPSFETKLVVEEDGAKQTSIIEKKEELTPDQKIEELSSKLEQLIEMQEQNTSASSDEPEQDEVEIDAESDAEVEKEVDESCGKPHSEGFKPSDLRTIDKEFVYAYMERAGSKNPQIQKIIYEQAEKAAKSSRPLYVLKQVVKILKTKK